MWTVTLRYNPVVRLKVDDWKVEGGALIVFLLENAGGTMPVMKRYAAYAADQWSKVEFTNP